MVPICPLYDPYATFADVYTSHACASTADGDAGSMEGYDGLWRVMSVTRVMTGYGG